MEKKRIWLICWTLFIGLGACWGTFMMWFDPAGDTWGMTPLLAWMQQLPFSSVFFQDFRWSGLFLLLVNGIPQLLTAVFLFKNLNIAPVAAMVCGVMLMLWIIVQFIIFPVNILSSLYFIFGLIEFLTAYSYYSVFKKNNNEMEKQIKIVEVFAGELWKATMIKEMLEENGIQAFLKDELLSSIAPFQVTAGGVDAVKVIVSDENYEKALKLIEQIK